MGMEAYRSETLRIYLRRMTTEDTDRIVAWRNTPEVQKNFIYQAPFTAEGHLNWIRTMVDTGKVVQMIICDLDTDQPLGSVYLRDIDRQHKKAEYGIFIGAASARGRGIGTEAARLMVQYGFKELKLHKLFLRVFGENMQAIRSYEKAGFVREAYLRDEVYVGGKFRDIVLMGILNPEDENEI